MTESTETELSAGEQTRQRVLGIAVDIARRDGIEAVTHKTVAAAAELSSSNVSYYFGKATDLRRAVARAIIDESVLVEFDHIESWVRRRLSPESAWFIRPGSARDHSHPDAEPGDALPISEAYVWLARNGVNE